MADRMLLPIPLKGKGRDKGAMTEAAVCSVLPASVRSGERSTMYKLALTEANLRRFPVLPRCDGRDRVDTRLTLARR